MSQANALYEQTLQRIADRLRNQGHLEVLGSIATDVVVETNNGSWHYPLIGAIDVVDPVDAEWMRRESVTARVITNSLLHPLPRPEIQVLWTGTDDAARNATVDLGKAHFVPNQNQ